MNNASSRSDHFFRVILFASILGCIVGLSEGATDILSGTVINSGWVPKNFQLTITTKALYVFFNTTVYMVFFQLAAVIATVAYFIGRKSDIFRRFPQAEVLSYWMLFYVILGVVLFANINEALWDETEILPIVGISATHLVFLGLVFLQIRASLKNISEIDSSEQAVVRQKNEARAAAYIILIFVLLFLPGMSETLASSIMRCISLFCVLIFVSPLAGLIDLGLGACRRQISRRWRLGSSSTAAAALVALIPACIVVPLGGKSIEEDIFSFSSEGSEIKSAPLKTNSPNVIILLIDMLRADHVHCYGYHRETTPFIDKYAGQGVLFMNARTQSSWTLPSTVTLLSGLYPSTHGAKAPLSALPGEIETMAEIFRNNGYSTAAFVSNPLLKKPFNVQQGFDLYCDDFMSYTYWHSAKRNTSLVSKSITALESTKLLSSRASENFNILNAPDISDADFTYWSDKMGIEKINSRAVNWVKKNHHRPFFLYLHYIDVHGPYIQARRFTDDVSDSKARQKINLYDGALKYTDSKIGLFIEELERLGVLEKSVVIITSDHGEEFHDHGGWYHGYNLFEEQLRIPLILLRTSAFPFSRKIIEPVGLIDVLPTLIDYLELETTNTFRDGRSFSILFNAGDRQDAPEYQFSETELKNLYRCVIHKDRWKFIYSEKSGVPKEWLFDLSQDPSEQVNLLKERPIMASELREKLSETFSQLESRTLSTNTVEPSKRTRRLLKSLGYLE